jgi:hypothetical protein
MRYGERLDGHPCQSTWSAPHRALSSACDAATDGQHIAVRSSNDNTSPAAGVITTD